LRPYEINADIVVDPVKALSKRSALSLESPCELGEVGVKGADETHPFQRHTSIK
jgi:hypothetical protein